ncbi:MAG: carboxypeptidase regulatory-like domain-containing protein, partial [Candidatus Eremiobacteraeota bacterium]|nr:carboxypeptidase regulatory-like domain-containing protein [Candidatus Eremiobacteraeota bacterium]
MKRSIAALFAVLFTFAFAPTTAKADTTGLVRGVVTFGGKPAEGVTITLGGEGAALHTTTDAGGAYQLLRVPVGHYTLTATKSGLPTFTQPVDVASDAIATVSFEMQLKTIGRTQTAYIRGAGSAPVSVNSISSAQLSALPENQSLDNVIETLPGIVRFSYNEPVAHGFHGLTYELDGVPLPISTTSNFSEIIDPRDID